MGAIFKMILRGSRYAWTGTKAAFTAVKSSKAGTRIVKVLNVALWGTVGYDIWNLISGDDDEAVQALGDEAFYSLVLSDTIKYMLLTEASDKQAMNYALVSGAANIGNNESNTDDVSSYSYLVLADYLQQTAGPDSNVYSPEEIAQVLEMNAGNSDGQVSTDEAATKGEIAQAIEALSQSGPQGLKFADYLTHWLKMMAVSFQE